MIKKKQLSFQNKKKKQVEIEAEADKFKVETQATAQLEAKKKEAEAIKTVGGAEADVIKAKGLSEAESKKQMELANVTAQTTLAKEIGENESYQTYLIKIREIEITGEVNKDENKINNEEDNLEVVKSKAHHFIKHRKNDIGKKMPDEENIEILCACGCGGKLLKFDYSNRPRKYIRGHNNRKNGN